jgi:hypothetical protein
MQKVVGSSPIIRLYTLQNGILRCLFGQQMTFCTPSVATRCGQRLA